jgi:hypothetical protein
MDDILKQMLADLKEVKHGQQVLEQGQNKLDAKIDGVNANLSDKINAGYTPTNR